MPEVISREELEKRLAALVGEELRQQLNELMRLLGDPPDLSKVTPEYWQNGGAQLREKVQPVLQEIYLTQARAQLVDAQVQLAGTELRFNWDLVNQTAVDWASGYTFDMVKDLLELSRQRLQEAVSEYYESPTTIGELIEEISPEFGAIRAEKIAVTEVTRSAVEGEQGTVDQLLEENPGIEVIDYWLTNRDEKVCKLCAPRHNQPRGTLWTKNPPAHPVCRCGVRRDFRRRKAE